MAQFTATSLARLLANVEREVLVEALDEAGMTQLLTSDTIKTISKLGRALEDCDQIARIKDSDSLLSFIPTKPFGLDGVVNVWQMILGELGLLPTIKSQIADVKRLIEGLEGDEPDDTPIDVIRKLISLVNLLVNYQQLPHDQYHPSRDADRRLAAMENIVRDLIATVPGEDI